MLARGVRVLGMPPRLGSVAARQWDAPRSRAARCAAPGFLQSALLTAVPGDKAPSDLVKDIDRSVAVRSALARREGEASFRAIELARAKLTDKDLPEDLAVPEPADIIDRTAAASIDALGAAAGATVAGLAMVTMGLPETVCAHGAVACGLTLFALRDVLWEEGTRSMGKAALDLEVSTWDGRIASHWQSLVRNLPVLVLPLWDVHPVAQQAFLLIVGFDIVSMVLTPDRRRIGDYMAATSCVTERPGRELRVMDLVERDELAAVEEAVSFIDPEALRTLQEGHEDDPVPLSAIAEAGGDIARMPDTKLLRRKAKRAVGPSIVLPGMMEARRQGTLGETKRRVQFVARSLDPEAPPPPPPPNASHAGDKEPQRQIGGGRGQ